MRLRVIHETAYRYGTPATRAIEILRVTPRSHDGQFVVDWRIEIDHDCRLEASTDAFGNTVHGFTVEGPLETLVITATGEVETEDHSGIIAGTVERFPETVFLRETALTRSDDTLRALGTEAVARGRAGLDAMHALNRLIGERMRFDLVGTDAGTTAVDAMQLGHGVCQDFAHIFISAARAIGVPARYVSGYLCHPGDSTPQEAGHGWAEAFVPGIGWVGFDPANGIAPTDAYVRVAIGLDYLSAAPIRGTRFGGTDETLAVRVIVEEAKPGRRAMQFQSGSGQSQSQIGSIRASQAQGQG